jgi:serine/threonine protein kinase/tetratricopeptide (TPR) repeat protein
MVGQTLGHYRIEQQIGAGGMGVVYRARDQRLDRDVALKLLPQGLLNDETAGELLRKEALALSKLNHPNIAHVYDFDTHDGVAFLIMEYVNGDTLARKLTGGPFPEEVAVSIGVQIASALEDAAEVGVVHRDIKPSNIMLTPKGGVKVLDFGLAKLFREGEHELTRSHTELPDAAGTLPYMAPERLKSEPADFRSDIYSLGSVLYEVVTGKRPFLAPDSATLIADILNKKPEPPHELNSALSTGFESAVMRCLAKEPARRYQRASELRVALESIQDSRRDIPHLAPSSTTFTARRALAVAALAIAIIAVGLLIWRAQNRIIDPIIDHKAPPNELAVLPLTGIGTDTEATAFGNGLVETLTSRLTQLSKDHPLQVVPASEMRTKGVTNLQEASKQFGATLGLTLNIERSGDQVRVNYSLVDAKQHKTLRADTIDAPASDPFALEDKVADSVVAALQIELTPAERAKLTQHGTSKPGADDYYLRGQGYLQEFQEPKNVDSAIAEFNHSLEQDPTFALAYAGLGQAYWHKYQISTNADWVANAKSACERAIALRNDEAAGHDCLGLVFNGTGAHENAVKEYQKAADLQPTDDAAFRGLATAYERLNKPEAAEETFSKAISLRPGYWDNYNSLGALFRRQGKYKDAEAQFSEVIALAPDSFVGYGNLGGIYISEGDYTKALPVLEHSVAIEPTADNTSNLATLYFTLRRFADSARLYEKAVTLNGNDYAVWGNLGDAYYWSPGERSKAAPAYHSAIDLAKKQLKINPRDATALSYLAGYQSMLGQSEAATDSINRALRIAPNDPDLLFDAAVVFNQLNAPEKSLDYLEKAVAAGYAANTLLDSPNLDNLHSHSRFQKLISKAPQK